MTSLDDLRAWAGQQLDLGVEASGIARGWYEGQPTAPWSEAEEHRRGILNSSFPNACGPEGAGRLDIALKNRSSGEDPHVVADRVRSFWEAQGWTVTDVWSTPSDDEEYFRADRDDGAILAFRSAAEGLVLTIHTVCSQHVTVTKWDLIPERTTPFPDELDRREGEEP